MRTTQTTTFVDGYGVMAALRRGGYTLIEDRDAPFRFVWLNPATRTLVTYCEGDLCMQVCDDDAELRAMLDGLRVAYGGLIEDDLADALAWAGATEVTR